MQTEEYKKIRKSAGMTQEKFASFLGCSFITVSRIENGHSDSSTTRMLYLSIKFICKEKLFKKFSEFVDKHK